MGLVRKFRVLFRSAKHDAEIEEELRFHLEMREKTNLEAGMLPDEARSNARRRFGNATLLKERTRDIDLPIFLETVIQDLRFGIRALMKNRAVTVIAILTLALGIGANTAIFSLLNAITLRDLPVPHPEQLVRVGVHYPNDPFTAMSLPIFEEFARDQKVLTAMFAWWGDAVLNVEANGNIARADIWAVTGNFFSELGGVPEIGRLLAPRDVNLRATPSQVAVLGYRFWQNHFGGRRDVIGKIVKIEGVPFTIIGVAHKDFTGITAEFEPELTVPLTAEPLFFFDPGEAQKYLNRRSSLWLEAAGRLKPGITLAQARAQLESLWPAIRKDMAPVDQGAAEMNHFMAMQVKVESGGRGASFLRSQIAKPLYILLGLTAVVLLLTCVNIAGLMLARAVSRSHEFGVRAALGASRARMVRQLLTESVTLSVAGALAGFALAYWGSRLLASFVASQIFVVPAHLNLSPDWRVLGLTATAAILTGILFGLAPAWRAAREDPQISIQQRARALASGTGALGKTLVIAQVAISLVLLTGAGLFIRTLQKLHATDPGFRTHSLLETVLFPKPGGYRNLAWVNYYHELTDRISALPGVISAGLVHSAPASMRWTEKIRISGAGHEEIRTDVEMLAPGAFQTLGIGLLRGRYFTWQDDNHAPFVAVVSKKLAEELFAGRNPIGQHLDFTTQAKWQHLRIIGVVTDASLYDLRQHQPATLYIASAQYGDYMGYPMLIVRGSVTALPLAGPIRRVVNSLGREYVVSFNTIEKDIDRSLYRERITAMLSAFFGGLALLLAAIGVYGLMAYNVTQRSREIAIRIAVGAQPEMVQRTVLREAIVLVTVGLAIGAPSSIACAKLISGMLYGVSAHDPITLAVVSLMLLAIAAIAAFVPSRRAMRLDPMAVLRCE